MDGRHVGLDFYDLLIEVLEQTTQPLLASNASRSTLRWSRPRKQQLVRLTLVIPLAVIVFAGLWCKLKPSVRSVKLRLVE